MKVKDAQFFAVVSSFLNVYLVKNRSCSSNTVKSYEDALNLFFTFLETAKAMVSEFLGHAQIETTKIYAHADTEMKRKAIQQAANKLNDTIPDALWNTDDEEMMLKLRGKQQYK